MEVGAGLTTERQRVTEIGQNIRINFTRLRNGDNIALKHCFASLALRPPLVSNRER